MRAGIPRTPYFFGESIRGTGAVGHGIPFHSRFLHVVHLGFRRTVRAYEYDFEVFLVCVAELDELGGETAAWRAPVSREIDSDGFAGQGVLGNFGSFCVEEGTFEQVGGAMESLAFPIAERPERNRAEATARERWIVFFIVLGTRIGLMCV